MYTVLSMLTASSSTSSSSWQLLLPHHLGLNSSCPFCLFKQLFFTFVSWCFLNGLMLQLFVCLALFSHRSALRTQQIINSVTVTMTNSVSAPLLVTWSLLILRLVHYTAAFKLIFFQFQDFEGSAEMIPVVWLKRNLLGPSFLHECLLCFP